MSNRRRKLRWSWVTAAAALTVVSAAPSAYAVDPALQSDVPTTQGAPAPTVPGGAADPSTSAPDVSDPSTSSTTTSTSLPPTTLPPVDDDTINGEAASGWDTSPAPLVPSADSDPLFHAALTVDDDLVVLNKARVTYLKSIATRRARSAQAASTRSRYDRVHATDVAARTRLSRDQEILRAAALHAYAGYGSNETAVGTPEVNTTETVLPYRTYVRVTVADASRHVRDATATRGRTLAVARRAKSVDDAAQGALSAALDHEASSKKALGDAMVKLAEDREALKALIATMPDMMPGAFDRFPDPTNLPAGAIPVESPLGTIVVPPEMDPRTATALQFIIAQIGKPYVWGATGPNTYDCSGLMLRGFQTAGVRSMPRVSQAQQIWATPVEPKDVRPGDLVFFGTPAYHVGVYIGGGLMIDAPFTGARVRVDRVWSSVSGYGRIVW